MLRLLRHPSTERARLAVIVATFEQPAWLDLCLRAWSRQVASPSQILVADDGSGPETGAVIARRGAVHVRRERRDNRFGKCAAVNGAVERARELGFEYLLFTDGDCLPARDLLQRHLAEARPGRFVAGGVVRLSREASESLRPEDVDHGAYERDPRCDKRRYALPRAAGVLLDALFSRSTPWKGGNSSAFLDDLVKVNGYDERFGWGSEDKELGVRLEHAGVRGFSIRYSAPVFHLWHERPYVRVEEVAKNRILLAETRRSRSSWTPVGLHRASEG
ncbi:MAG TPA: glycosyltransferase [Myxococcales bacterium]|jgi:glycosyltransferase involved in cell wall biosynthesis|nr:glycosyltransferase [Myxococcales bacterium]